MLTEIVPGAGPAGGDDLGDMGIAEIPLADVVTDSSASAELARTPLFGSLPEESLRGLIERIELVSLKEGEVLFHQGDRADTLYIVAEGAVIPIAEEKGRRKLAVLEPGSFFGEIGLMTNQPRNATITAMVDSRLLAIDRKVMWQMIKKHPPVLQVMLRFLRDRVVDRLLRSNPFFLAFPARDRPAVAKLFRFIEARDGRVLIEEKQPAENLYALLSGTVQVIQMGTDGDKVLAELGPGSLFGEMSLLDTEPAVASVVASGKCWALALSRERLVKLMRGNPEAARIIQELARERISQNEGRLKAFIPRNDDPLGSV
jgi:CRP-like cAMP-binding protein